MASPAAAAACRAFVPAGLAVKPFQDSLFKDDAYIQSKRHGRSIGFFRSFTDHQRYSLHAKSLLDKPKGIPSGGSHNGSDSNDPARAALERLFLQTLKLENRAAESSGILEPQLNLTLSDLEVDLHTAIEALRLKEEQLRDAELRVKADQQEVIQAKSELLQRERELQAAHANHIRIKDELIRTKQESCEHAVELQSLKEDLKKRENDIIGAQGSLNEKQDELTSLRRDLLEKNDALAIAAAELESRDLRLDQAKDFISSQSVELTELRNSLDEKERQLLQAEKDRQIQQRKLEAAEADLEERAISLLVAQEELRALERELLKSRSKADMTDKELDKSKALLDQVRAELQASQKVIGDFRSKMEGQEILLSRQQDELSQKKETLKKLEAMLEEALQEVLSDREQMKLMQSSYKELEDMLHEGKEKEAALQAELQREKSSLLESIEEVNLLKRELRLRDSVLTDTQLLLQLKEAELVAAKLEVQEVNSDMTSVQHALRDRGIELELTQRTAKELEKGVLDLRSALKAKEEQLAQVNSLLKEREEELDVMRISLDDNKVQLSEAISLVEQIAALSQTLVDAANEGKAAIHDEKSLLTETNCELFVANRVVLEKELQLQFLQEKSAEDALKRQEAEAELEAVKDCLRDKENELLEAQKDLAIKDQELKKLLYRWEVREAELSQLRKEVMEEAKGLTTLHTLAQSQGINLDQSPGDAAIEKLELESTKLEVEAAMCALRSIAELSEALLNDNGLNDGVVAVNGPVIASNPLLQENTKRNMVEEQATPVGPLTLVFGDSEAAASEFPERAFSNFSNTQDLEALKLKLKERDTALECTRNAVYTLADLTRKLMAEAGLGPDLVTATHDIYSEPEIVAL